MIWQWKTAMYVAFIIELVKIHQFKQGWHLIELCQPFYHGLTLARSGGGLMQPPPPPWVAGRHTVWRIVLKFSIAYGASFAQLLVKKMAFTKLWRHKRNNLRKISAKSWINATWRGAIDLNGDSWWDWCQYMTGCDPWHCARWGSRSTEVNWIMPAILNHGLNRFIPGSDWNCPTLCTSPIFANNLYIVDYR